MAQDIVADGLNQIMNIKRVGKTEVVLTRYSKLLLNVLDAMKKDGHLDYELNEEERKLTVKIIKLNVCKAIKPRYFVSVSDIEKYLRRFLPSRNFGVMLISTNKGLVTHAEAEENKIGGSLIAYFY